MSKNFDLIRSSIGACPARSNFDTTVIAAIRHRSRAIASESGAGGGSHPVKLLRPLVAQAHGILRERFEAGGSVEDYLRDRAILVCSTLHRYPTGYVIGAWLRRSRRLRWVVMDERS